MAAAAAAAGSAAVGAVTRNSCSSSVVAAGSRYFSVSCLRHRAGLAGRTLQLPQPVTQRRVFSAAAAPPAAPKAVAEQQQGSGKDLTATSPDRSLQHAGGMHAPPVRSSSSSKPVQRLAGSLLPPPEVPGIRRAPREAADGDAAATLADGRMRIRLPPPGSRFRHYVDPRMDSFLPLTATFIAVVPLYWFGKFFF